MISPRVWAIFLASPHFLIWRQTVCPLASGRKAPSHLPRHGVAATDASWGPNSFTRGSRSSDGAVRKDFGFGVGRNVSVCKFIIRQVWCYDTSIVITGTRNPTKIVHLFFSFCMFGLVWIVHAECYLKLSNKSECRKLVIVLPHIVINIINSIYFTDFEV